MHPIVAELEQLVELGAALVAQADWDPLRWQEFLAARETVCGQLNRTSAQLNEHDRQRISRSIEAILHIDATILAELEKRRNAVGKELLAARKFHGSVGTGVHTQPSLLLRRVL